MIPHFTLTSSVVTGRPSIGTSRTSTPSSTTDGSLHLAYQKYKAFLEANATLALLYASGEWEEKKPSVTDLIEIFQSK